MPRRLFASLILALAFVAPVATPVRAVPLTAKTTVVITKHPGAVGRNKTARLDAKTTPGSISCNITVHYKSGPGKAAGLTPKKSDTAGNVSWSWKVGGNTTKGTWPITVNCAGAKATSTLTVP